MHTIQTSMVFTVVMVVLCGIIVANPGYYVRTQELARLSVICQNEGNTKRSIFELRNQQKDRYSWDIEISCPEKAYRLGKGLRDSLDILID
ncbi:MAG: hypothetical protein IK020_01545 [Clostridiales bacterium]|nr:hypothetical protein [Clostridiales bacterium]